MSKISFVRPARWLAPFIATGAVAVVACSSSAPSNNSPDAGPTGGDPCTAIASCDACQSHQSASCAFCPATGTCVASSGSCGGAGFAAPGSCPLATGADGGGDGSSSSDPCSVNTTCESCTAVVGCGFCGANAKCLSGVAGLGPTNGGCTANYAFNSTAACKAGTTETNTAGPTTLPVDCRIPANRSDVHCKSPSHGPPSGTVGTGPNLAAPGIGAELTGCFADSAAPRVVVGATYDSGGTDPAIGMVMTIDIATGNRTMISGAWTDAATGAVKRGAGPNLGAVYDVKPAPDGGWYAANKSQIFHVDPTSGDRTLVWDSSDAAHQCSVGGTAIKTFSGDLTVASDGTIYLSRSDVPGIFAIKSGTCSLVMTEGTRGTGPHLQGVGFTHLISTPLGLFADIFLSESVIKIDTTSGNWTRLSSADPSAMVGTGGPLGSGQMTFTGGRLWVIGAPGGSFAVASIDPATGNRNSYIQDNDSGPAALGGEGRCFAELPNTNQFLANIGEWLYRYEPVSGESNLISN